jgi:putative NIF3 family GTP cyclohydrolase 1 type 2
LVKTGLDTLITGEADYPTEVKVKELGNNLILVRWALRAGGV